jgi:leucyl aminopeptidase
MNSFFHLIDAPAGGAIPIRVVTKSELAEWRADQPARVGRWLDAGGFRAEGGAVALVPDADGGVETVLVGRKADTPDLWRLAGLPTRLPDGVYRLEAGAEPTAAALGWALGCYRFTRYKEAKNPLPSLAWPEGADRSAVIRTAEAVCLARDLINTPAQDMGPSTLAAAARDIAEAAGATIHVIEGDALIDANYPAIHAVGRAAADPPRLIDLTWNGAGDDADAPANDLPRVTLVGKGVCFDSGGLDLKTFSGMKLMKKDMGGAAHVLGLAAMIMAAKLPLRLRVLIPAVDNAVSGNAFRPLDVVRTRKGLTVEVGNTDAEGRVILADALAEAASEKPAMLLDFATLTGAARVALGTELPALFANDDALAEDLLAHGRTADDPLWRLPLWPGYRKLIDGQTADVTNSAESPFGGAITAALFLQEFVGEGVPWAHVDTFGWNANARPGRPKGGEALGLRAAFAMIAARFG